MLEQFVKNIDHYSHFLGYASFANPPQLPNTSFSNPVTINQPIKVIK